MFLWGLEQALASKINHNFYSKGLSSGLLEEKSSAGMKLYAFPLVPILFGFGFGTEGRVLLEDLQRSLKECQRLDFCSDFPNVGLSWIALLSMFLNQSSSKSGVFISFSLNEIKILFFVLNSVFSIVHLSFNRDLTMHLTTKMLKHVPRLH